MREPGRIEIPVPDDPGLYSVRVDVWEQLKAKQEDQVQGPHRRFAAVREALDAADKHLAALFTRYETCRAELEQVGVVAQMKLTAPLDAAYREWIRAGSDEPLPRVFTEIPDPPIGPEPDDGC
jgi:hypothetical protein